MNTLGKQVWVVAMVFVFACTGVSTSSAQTATLIYNDGDGAPAVGSYLPGTSFTFSINMFFAPGGSVTNLVGLSYWFQQQTPAGAPFPFAITLRDVTGSLFTDLQTPGLTYPQTLAPQSDKDLGAIKPDGIGVGTGTYLISNITISIDPSAPLGTYLIGNTTSGGKTSVISDDVGHTFAIPSVTYEIDVIPEPATWLAGGLSLAALLGYHRRRRAN